ncbi:MAG: hypothetical protein PHE89_02730 [Alphaproteobacteria bacterium]|nr:hypothetical protein [Alphaproteobacteria bacterium]
MADEQLMVGKGAEHQTRCFITILSVSDDGILRAKNIRSFDLSSFFQRMCAKGYILFWHFKMKIKNLGK